MAKVDWKNGLYSLNARGKYSDPNGFGLFKFGWSKLGYKNEKAGYYQRHWNGQKFNWIRAKHYWPENTETETRRAWRNKFAEGVAQWHLLAPAKKLYYNNLKYPTGQTGFTRFMSEYLKPREDWSNFPYLLPKSF